jgi:hypothetical protein
VYARTRDRARARLERSRVRPPPPFCRRTSCAERSAVGSVLPPCRLRYHSIDGATAARSSLADGSRYLGLQLNYTLCERETQLIIYEALAKYLVDGYEGYADEDELLSEHYADLAGAGMTDEDEMSDDLTSECGTGDYTASPYSSSQGAYSSDEGEKTDEADGRTGGEGAESLAMSLTKGWHMYGEYEYEKDEDEGDGEEGDGEEDDGPDYWAATVFP